MLIFKSAIVPYLAYAAMKEWKYTHFQLQLTVPLLSGQYLTTFFRAGNQNPVWILTELPMKASKIVDTTL